MPLGDPLAEGTRLGPLVSAAQRDRVLGYIERGAAEGARTVTGGPQRPAGLSTGYYVLPTVFADVKPDMAIAQEEIFGPVLSIIDYASEDEAVEIANGTPYGLAAGGLVGGPGSCGGGRAAGCGPARSRSTAGRSTWPPRSAGSGSPATAGNSACTAWRSTWR